MQKTILTKRLSHKKLEEELVEARNEMRGSLKSRIYQRRIAVGHEEVVSSNENCRASMRNSRPPRRDRINK